MRKLVRIFTVLSVMAFFMAGFMGMAQAASPGAGKKILFVPLDNRPITDRDTGEVAEKLGYDVVIPPEELLGTRDQYGDPEGLWRWLRENARGADAAVISTDAMLYGSLVGSRNHDLSGQTIQERAERFREFHKEFPRLPIYAFGTILRTLSSPKHSGGMEPKEYEKYAMKIYDYSILRDKIDMGISTGREKKAMEKLEREIPQAALDSWEERHKLNYAANETLVDITGEDAFAFFLLGCDDSAPLSQTHYESRHLQEYGKALGKTRFQVMSGADELAMVMLARAVNDDVGDIPFVYAAYNEGLGRDVIPRFSNERIGKDVEGAVTAAGGLIVPDPARAEFVLAVSTNPDGTTGEANSPSNTTRPRRGTEFFVSMVKELVEKGYPVGVGDIAYANGADNALMERLRRENLLFRLRAYGGWNTATNTTGFLIGTGLLTKWMTEKDARELMLKRYLDEWAYQANLRQRLVGELGNLPGEGTPAKLGEKRPAAEKLLTRWMGEFAKENIALPAGLSLARLRVTLPWSRTFECRIDF